MRGAQYDRRSENRAGGECECERGQQAARTCAFHEPFLQGVDRSQAKPARDPYPVLFF
jgi:hypothetical protein